MKKILTMVLAAALMCFGALALAGCQDNSEQVIRDGVSKELNQIKNLDDAYVKELASQQSFTQLQQYGVNSENFIKALFGGFDYSIKDISVKDNKATITMTITSKDFSTFQKDLTNMVNSMDYTKFSSVDDALNFFGTECMKLIENMPVVESQPFTITCTKKDNTWVVDDGAETAIMKAMGLSA